MSTTIVPYTIAEVNSLSSVHGSSERSFSNESGDIQPVLLPTIPPPALLVEREDSIDHVYESEISSSQSAPAMLSTSVINIEQSEDVPSHVKNTETKVNEMNSDTHGVPIVINYPTEHDEEEIVTALDGGPLSFVGYGIVGFIAGLGLSLFSCFSVRCPGCHQASMKQQVAFVIGASLGAVVNTVLVVLYFTVLNHGEPV